MAVNYEARLWNVDDPNEILRCRSPQQKPFIRVRFPTGEVVELSYELAEWLGTEARMLRQRHEFAAGPSIPAKKYKARKQHAQS